MKMRMTTAALRLLLYCIIQTFGRKCCESFSFGKSVNDSIAANHNEQTIFYKLNEENYYENENIT